MTNKKSLIIRLKQKINLIKKIKYWLTIDELKTIANSYLNGILHYGITVWAKSNYKLIDKIEKLRVKTIKVILDKDKTDNLSNEQVLKLFNWSTIEQSKTIAEHVIIHKVLNKKNLMINIPITLMIELSIKSNINISILDLDLKNPIILSLY